MRSAISIGVVVAGLVTSLVACGGDGVSREVGARCERTADCADRCLAPSNDYPAGFCTLDCSSSRECPSDAECVDREGGVCLFYCRDNRDCDFLGPGWTCQEANLRDDTSLKVTVCRGE